MGGKDDDRKLSETQFIKKVVEEVLNGHPQVNCVADPATVKRHESMLHEISSGLTDIKARLESLNSNFGEAKDVLFTKAGNNERNINLHDTKLSLIEKEVDSVRDRDLKNVKDDIAEKFGSLQISINGMKNNFKIAVGSVIIAVLPYIIDAGKALFKYEIEKSKTKTEHVEKE